MSLLSNKQGENVGQAASSPQKQKTFQGKETLLQLEGRGCRVSGVSDEGMKPVSADALWVKISNWTSIGNYMLKVREEDYLKSSSQPINYMLFHKK